MIYRIATAASGGRGLVGVYPEWGDSGAESARILAASRHQDLAILFTRNHPAHFAERIVAQLLQYGRYIDIVCGWELRQLRMIFGLFNPDVETLRLSAMNFNHFALLDEVRRETSRSPEGDHDIFFAASERPDELKNCRLLARLLGGLDRHVRVVGYGRLEEATLASIRSNRRISFDWRGKSKVTDPVARRAFLTTMAQSRSVLVTSRVEGYCRLIGEALLLSVPILLPATLQCENWIHLHPDNCRLYHPATFALALENILARTWRFDPPSFEDGNERLQEFVMDYLARRGMPQPAMWQTLGYGAFPSRAEGGE